MNRTGSRRGGSRPSAMCIFHKSFADKIPHFSRGALDKWGADAYNATNK